MKKIEYTKPAVRVKIVMVESLLNELSKNSNDEVDPEEGGAWSKDGDLEYFNYSTSRNVWDD